MVLHFTANSMIIRIEPLAFTPEFPASSELLINNPCINKQAAGFINTSYVFIPSMAKRKNK